VDRSSPTYEHTPPRYLCKSHSSAVVDRSSPTYERTPPLEIPLDGSQWIVQVQPTNTRLLWKSHSTAVSGLFKSHLPTHTSCDLPLRIPLDGSQWIVQVQPTNTRVLATFANPTRRQSVDCSSPTYEHTPLNSFGNQIALLCRWDLNNPLTAVEWDSREIKSGFCVGKT
jgi:hypothetical protein